MTASATKKLTQMNSHDVKELLMKNAIVIVILMIIIGIIIKEPAFLSGTVFKNILTQSAVRLILAFGVGGIKVAGRKLEEWTQNFDLRNKK